MIIDDGKYCCECGRSFETLNSLKSHAGHCDKYIQTVSKSRYLIGTRYVCECGREFDNHQSLNDHLGHCKIHHEAFNKPIKQRIHQLNHSMCWESKTKEEISSIYRKSQKTYRKKLENGEISFTWKGKKLPESMKEKIRISRIEYIKRIKGGCNARYNPRSIEYIDRLNAEKGWNLQHAENGGEKHVAGYFLDGYDEKLNIAFEYDEAKHYIDVENSVLREKDIIRQQNIIEKLGCEFYRYNEKMNCLYKVN